MAFGGHRSRRPTLGQATREATLSDFLKSWNEAAVTSLGLFWMALWAFCLGYVFSSLIQVLVTRARMQRAMGESGPKAMALGTFFGFISSSCSFAALSTTRALFQKGAGLAPSIAFMLASTNLVVELGIVIAIFLGWQFVVGEYVGGLLLIAFAWLFVRVTNPQRMIERTRERLAQAHGEGDGEIGDWKRKVRSLAGWQAIGRTYVMEWRMVWKDVLVGFTVAGAISAFVPPAFFQTLFVGSGGADAANPDFHAVLAHTLIGPLAAFLTFIGSMGNIPLAALLFDNGVCFAGVMAFIFSDLVVLPVLRINAGYYGWKMALYLLAMLLCGLVVASLLLHYALAALDALPTPGEGRSIAERDFFAIGYGFVLNLVLLAVTAVLAGLWWSQRDGNAHAHVHQTSLTTYVLRLLAGMAMLWLAGGLLLAPRLG